MPLEKKRISELEEAQDVKGFFTIGYRIIDGVKTSLKFGLEKIQTAYEDMVAIKDDALAAIRDIRSLESTVESNEEVRETEENRRKGEYGGIIQELQQAGQASSGHTALAKQATDEANAAALLANQKAALAGEKAVLADAAADSVNTSKDAAIQAATGANAAKETSVSQTALSKQATDDANAAAGNANQKATLAEEKASLADAAAASANNAVAGVDAKVKAAIDALVAGAPGALDTLNELAAAMGNDPNFAATIVAELGKKLNRADIVNNLTSGGTDKPLSAEMGKSLKSSLDSHYHDDRYERIINKLTAFNKNFGTTAGTVCQGDDSRLNNARTPLAHIHKVSDISNFPSSMPASDVQGWAKQSNKPAYSPSEVGAAPSSHGHGAGEISQDTNHRFVTDGEKNEWNSKAAGGHNHSGVYQPAGNYSVTGHGHTASDVGEEVNKRFMTDGEREKLGGIADGANNYNHPANHPASMIEEETNKRFMTDAERSALSSLGTSYAKADFSNITSKSMGQNGYYKLPDGLLIQWGYSAATSQNKVVYFPISFFDINYSVVLSLYVESAYLESVTISYKGTTYFKSNGKAASGGNIGPSKEPLYWFAIGRWK